MGPQRTNWSYPKKAQSIIAQCVVLEKKLAQEIDQNISNEQAQEKQLAEYRETLRRAGVTGWEYAQMPSKSIDFSTIRNDSYRKKTKLEELQRIRKAIEEDLERDPHRIYKLGYQDLEFFEF